MKQHVRSECQVNYCWIVPRILSRMCSFVFLSTAFVPSFKLSPPWIKWTHIDPCPASCDIKWIMKQTKSVNPKPGNPSTSVVVLNTWTKWSRNIEVFFTEKSVRLYSVIHKSYEWHWTHISFLNKDSSLAFFHYLPFKSLYRRWNTFFLPVLAWIMWTEHKDHKQSHISWTELK